MCSLLNKQKELTVGVGTAVSSFWTPPFSQGSQFRINFEYFGDYQTEMKDAFFVRLVLVNTNQQKKLVSAIL